MAAVLVVAISAAVLVLLFVRFRSWDRSDPGPMGGPPTGQIASDGDEVRRVGLGAEEFLAGLASAKCRELGVERELESSTWAAQGALPSTHALMFRSEDEDQVAQVLFCADASNRGISGRPGRSEAPDTRF